MHTSLLSIRAATATVTHGLGARANTKAGRHAAKNQLNRRETMKDLSGESQQEYREMDRKGRPKESKQEEELKRAPGQTSSSP